MLQILMKRRVWVFSLFDAIIYVPLVTLTVILQEKINYDPALLIVLLMSGSFVLGRISKYLETAAGFRYSNKK